LHYVSINRDLCIGAATCVALAPEVFTLDSEAKAIILDTGINTSGEVLIDAARGCPTAAISIMDATGNKIAP
jgi:ferredoxin